MPASPSGLLDRLHARDPAALREVVDANARRLYRAARGMGFGAAEADDLAQDVFVTCLETIDRFEGRSSIGTWLFGILRFKVRERWRLQAREEFIDPIDETFESRFDTDGTWARPPLPADRLAESHEVAAALHECLDGMPGAPREVFQLRQVEELTAVEVGEIMDCTPNHVGVLLHRARLRLRECLETKGWGRSR